jgi:predicted enzyme related to lactoylglutathione lyase
VPVRAPDSPATFSHTLHLEVDDVDGTTERARRSGASVEREPADQPYGRGSVIVDPFGHRWMLLRPPARATRLRQGDVANVTMVARDARQAREFYEAVLRVPFSSGHPARGAPTRPGRRCASCRRRVRSPECSCRTASMTSRPRSSGSGGRGPGGGAQAQPFGLLADCVDDQGATFRLWQPAD